MKNGEFPRNGFVCSVCGLPQFTTPAGATCPDGHGGARGVAPQGPIANDEERPIKKDDRLVVIDLETSGLSPTEDVVLEVGAIVLTPDLKPIPLLDESYFFHRLPQYRDDINAILTRSHPRVREMHAQSGLAADSMRERSEAPTDLQQVEDDLVNWLADDHGFATRSVVLCGSSVHWDREFVRATMPRVFRLLHWRILDVSAIREAYLRWVDPDYSKRWKEENGEAKHRVIDDIQMSIKELEFFRRRCFQ